ncbi:hypothetical protein Q9S78_11935 [Microbacterium sp. KSW-18]|uniref:Uncharacterized protein n=1 Tax=Microbacterium aquilitoris TaxID=3067307 RepID=A0ABU3GP87_9MICO|nr:hypothetical protein [Microbacterium sp. KSW-18]MDT3331379.1 hypothetical protein [Microbacterium sp. KSW-18]
MRTIHSTPEMLDINSISERYPHLTISDVLAKIPHTDDYRWKGEDVRAYIATEPNVQCPWHWCEVDHSKDETDNDREYHRKEVQISEISVCFALNEGEPRLVWLPDFEEWTFDPTETEDLLLLSEAFATIHAMYRAFLQEVTA